MLAGKLSPARVALGAAVMLLAYAFILGVLRFGALCSSLSDTRAEAAGGGLPAGLGLAVAGMLVALVGDALGERVRAAWRR